MSVKPLLAVTMGDPAGIGAEVVVKAFQRASIFADANPFVLGSEACLKLAMLAAGIDLPLKVRRSLAELESHAGVIELIEPVEFLMDQHVYGQVSAAAGRAAVGYFETAVRMALAGDIQAVVTCPINKEAVHAAG
ncbi:MAG: 4-hydroxy-L-threonine phosphate dehydrogenase PdxA, partial [Candidatus Azotimanducaceae bacterium]